MKTWAAGEYPNASDMNANFLEASNYFKNGSIIGGGVSYFSFSYSDNPSYHIRFNTQNIWVYDFDNLEHYYTLSYSIFGAGNTNFRGAVIVGNYIYVLMSNTVTPINKVYRFDLINGGNITEITGLSQTQCIYLFGFDGTNFYFSNQGGNSATKNIVKKMSLSGTTLTSVADITLTGVSMNDSMGIGVIAGNYYNVSSTNIFKNAADGSLTKTMVVGNSSYGIFYHTVGGLFRLISPVGSGNQEYILQKIN